MTYTEIIMNIKETYPNVHIEAGFDGWDWFFSNGELVATYNDCTGELVEVLPEEMEVV